MLCCNYNNIKLYDVVFLKMNKMLGIIPVCCKSIENKYPEELDSVNITGVYVSNQIIYV